VIHTPSIALFYGSSSGTTAEAAERLVEVFGVHVGVPIALFDVATTPLAAALEFSHLILGCPTWYAGELQDDWNARLGELEALDLTGKRVALFGTGDQVGYGDTFGDALGILGATCRKRGAQLVGAWSTAGYTFRASKAIEDGLFLGLILDEDNQPHLSHARMQAWVAQLAAEWGLRVQVPG
jgi:flavodoxin I